MLIEQINELEFRRPVPGRTCTPITAYFNDKTKISKKNLRVDYYLVYLLLKYCRRQCALLTSSYLGQITQNLALKCLILNVFWT